MRKLEEEILNWLVDVVEPPRCAKQCRRLTKAVCELRLEKLGAMLGLESDRCKVSLKQDLGGLAISLVVRRKELPLTTESFTILKTTMQQDYRALWIV